MVETSETKKSTVSTGFDKNLAKILCEIEKPSGVKLSSKGDRVVYEASPEPVKDGQSRSALWIASTSEPGSARKLTSGQFRDASPVWHPDGQHVAFLSNRWKGSGSGIWMLRLDGGDACPLLPTDIEQPVMKFVFSPDGGTVAYLAKSEKSQEDKERDAKGDDRVNVWGEHRQYCRLHLLDVKAQQVRTIVEGNRHVSNFAWSHNGKDLVFHSTETDDANSCFLDGTTVSTVNVESGKVRNLCTVQTSVSHLAWGTNDQVYFRSQDTQVSRFSCEVVFAIDTNQEHSKVVKVACGETDSAAGFVAVDMKLLIRRCIRHKAAITELNGNDVFVPDGTIQDWDVVLDAESREPIIAAIMSDTNQADEVFLIKGGQTHMQLSNHGNILEKRQFGSFKILTCQSSDGEVGLDGLYLSPASTTSDDGTPNEPLPTVVLIHGGPLDHFTNSFDPVGFVWTPYLLSRGYGILLPQYRGSTGRGEKFASYSSQGMGKYAYEDVIAITDNAVKKGFADGKRVMVGGWSAGGALTFMSAVRNGLHDLGWRFNAAVGGGVICDTQTLTLTSDLGTTILVELSGGPAPWLSNKSNTNSRESSAIWEVKSAVEESQRRGQPVIPPVLILHGENDNRCPVSQAKAFHHALMTSGLPCELVIYPGSGHGPSRYVHWMDMLERLGRWCDTYIGF